MLATLKYAWLTWKHKWFVYVAGRKLGCPRWRLIKHDLSKFSPSELPHYGRQFFGKADDPEGFIRCWIHHQNSNEHHWEYWIPRTGHNRCDPPYPDGQPIRIPRDAMLEMVADWMGASRAYEGSWPTEEWKWWNNSWTKVLPNLHPDTAAEVVKLVDAIRARGED